MQMFVLTNTIDCFAIICGVRLTFQRTLNRAAKSHLPARECLQCLYCSHPIRVHCLAIAVQIEKVKIFKSNVQLLSTHLMLLFPFVHPEKVY
jgi:hypothetical protein